MSCALSIFFYTLVGSKPKLRLDKFIGTGHGFKVWGLKTRLQTEQGPDSRFFYFIIFLCYGKYSIHKPTHTTQVPNQPTTTGINPKSSQWK